MENISNESKQGMRKIYRKSWPYDNLFGSTRFELTASQRGVWNDFLDWAKLSRVRPGMIAPNDKQAYPHAWMAQFLNIDLELLEETIKVLIKTGRIVENGSGIEILNWGKYQTEYDRQKPSREAKKKDYENQKYGHIVKK